MNERILILGAGTGASNNLVRSLKAGDPSVVVVGVQSDRFSLCRSSADRRYLTPKLDAPAFGDALTRVIRKEAVDLIFPNTDAEVLLVSSVRHGVPCRVFLPAEKTIELCMDKYRLGVFLRGRAMPAPLTYPIEHLDEVETIWAKFDRPSKLWCRMRVGAGSMGALPAATPAQARAWIEYWQDMRGVPPGDFTLSEYLPGRDFACQTLWKDGKMVLLKTVERLAYFGGTAHPSGVSSIAAVAKTVDDSRVAAICEQAVRAIDPAASGAFSVDLKEDASGVPNITEINVGRFITMMNFFDFVGAFNMSTTYVSLGLDEPVEIANPYDVAEDFYFVRDVDTTPMIVHVDKLFDNIETA
jgi:carbamoylphosphate synthase large subunit